MALCPSVYRDCIGVVTQQAVACTLAKQHFEMCPSGYRVKAQTSEIAQRQEIVHDQLLPRWHKGTGFQHLAKQGYLRWMALTNHFDELAHQCRWRQPAQGWRDSARLVVRCVAAAQVVARRNQPGMALTSPAAASACDQGVCSLRGRLRTA